jgi:hypothetical protein
MLAAMLPAMRPRERLRFKQVFGRQTMRQLSDFSKPLTLLVIEAAQPSLL